MSAKIIALCFSVFAGMCLAAERPNVIVIMADDVGYGDLECHGNSLIKTPHLNSLRKESAAFDRYYVSPTCSPSRAALMTGRWPFSVGVNHTIAGRSLLKDGVPTVAEIFQRAGYRTGIFGKWHLGDSAPSRPEDRGFQEVFIHKGGGIGQAPDYWGNSYFDPMIWHNGTWVKTRGFCTEVFMEEALNWSKKESKQPFFAFIPLNVAHTPWTVKEEWRAELLARGVPKDLADFYALIEDMDEQLGAFLKQVDGENTIVWFMSDNGTAGGGYNAGMKGRKGTVNEGGIRVPSFVRWTGKISPDVESSAISGHVDFLPTICALAGVAVPAELELHGVDQSGLLKGRAEKREERLWFSNLGRWTGREDPALARMRHFAVRGDKFQLIEGELFDFKEDPGEKTNIIEEHGHLAVTMLRAYQQWWDGQRNEIFGHVPSHIGDPREKVAQLCVHDWYPSDLAPQAKAAEGLWDQWQLREHLKQMDQVRKGAKVKIDEVRGYWKVKAVQDGRYRMTLRMLPEEALASKDKELAVVPSGVARLLVGRNEVTARLRGPLTAVPLELDLVAGEYDLEAWFEGQFPQEPKKTLGCFFVDVERIGEMAVRKK